jgi:large conductance mechanosensitive channel
MSIVKEFKEFAMKGNVVDLAVGVIIGGAFGKIVSVLVEKVIMPPIGLLVGGVDFTQLKLILKAAAADGKGEVAIGYGDFLQTVVNFLIVAGSVFAMVKIMNSLKRLEVAPVTPPPPPEDTLLLRDILETLKKR